MANFAHPAARSLAAAAQTAAGEPRTLRAFFGVFRYSPRALKLVWRTNSALTICLGILTVIAGVLPAGVAYLGSLIVDAVVAAVQHGAGIARVIGLVRFEGVVVGATAAGQGGIRFFPVLP